MAERREEYDEEGKDMTLLDEWEERTEKIQKCMKRAFNIGACVACALFIVMVVLGIVYFGSCPAQNYLPVYLIVSGTFSVGFVLLKGFANCCCLNEDDQRPFVFNALLFLTGVMLMAWFIAGSVWVYSMYDNISEDIRDRNYCNTVLYVFSFWLVSLTNGLIAIILVCSSVWYAYRTVLKLNDRS